MAPVSAYAATPVQTLAARAAPAVQKPLATVDHPPVDGVQSFDNGSRAGNQVALTFDADMTTGMLSQLRAGSIRSWYNADVIQALRDEHVPATLFLTGLWAQTYPDAARDLAQDPLFEIGSHTQDHLAFRTPCYGLGAAYDRAGEITQAASAINAATGLGSLLLRFPGDCYDRSDTALAGSLGYRVISGDVRGGDAFNQSAVSVASTVLRSVQPGSIVILHLHGGPNAPMTAPALRMIIPGLRARGLEFTTVSRLLNLEPPPPAPAPRPPSAEELLVPLRAPALVAPQRLGLLRLRSAPLGFRRWVSLTR